MGFCEVVFQAPGPVFQGAADGASAGSQTPLVQCHQKSYGARPGGVTLLGGAGALPFDEPGNRVVQIQFGSSDVKAGGVGDAPGEHRCRRPFAIRLTFREIDHRLFGAAQVERSAPLFHSPADGLDVGISVLVQQLQKQSKVLWVALVRRSREQQDVVGAVPQDFAQLITLAFMAFVARGHPVRLVHYHQIPTRLLQSGQNVVPLGQVQRGDYLIAFLPFVGPELVANVATFKDKERFLELLPEFPLPLEGEVGWADYGNAFCQAAQFQFADEQAGHNGLAGAGVIGQQEPHAGQFQQVLIDGF